MRSLTSDLVRAEPIESGLHPRIIGRADAVLGVSWRAVYVRRGRVDILSDEPAATLVGPSVAWLPWGDGLRLRIAAGTVGVHVLAGAAAVTNAIGYKAESADLRMTADRRIRMSLLDDPRAAETVAQCFGGILGEARGNAVSSPTVIEAFLRILLITLWRGRGAPSAGLRAAPTAQRLMSRFNALLEAHFRERWTVGTFADRLGISADRLTDICRRARDATPKHLLDARIVTEARLLLENSAHSIDEIAGLLGFPSAGHFSRFFRNGVGVPPGRYRQSLRSRPSRHETAGQPLHEWP
jgi:AraC family transcriptional activator of pobA